MNWQAIEAIGVAVAAVAAFATTLVAYWHMREFQNAAKAIILQMTKTMMVQIARDLEAEFHSADMINARKAASATLLENNFDAGLNNPSINSVIGFFDSIGMLLQRDAIDASLVFHAFGRRSVAYWEFTRCYIEHRRTPDNPVWNDFDGQLVRLMKSYMDERGYSYSREICEQYVRRDTELK